MSAQLELRDRLQRHEVLHVSCSSNRLSAASRATTPTSARLCGLARCQLESRPDVGLKRAGSAHLGWRYGPALANAIGAGVTPGFFI